MMYEDDDRTAADTVGHPMAGDDACPEPQTWLTLVNRDLCSTKKAAVCVLYGT